MHRFVVVLGVIGVLAMVGCSSISVRHDFDTGADFSQYQSFAWLPQPIDKTSGSAQQARQRNDLMDKRVLKSVNTQLTEKGLSQPGSRSVGPG